MRGGTDMHATCKSHWNPSSTRAFLWVSGARRGRRPVGDSPTAQCTICEERKDNGGQLNTRPESRDNSRRRTPRSGLPAWRACVIPSTVKVKRYFQQLLGIFFFLGVANVNAAVSPVAGAAACLDSVTQTLCCSGVPVRCVTACEACARTHVSQNRCGEMRLMGFFFFFFKNQATAFRAVKSCPTSFRCHYKCPWLGYGRRVPLW